MELRERASIFAQELQETLAGVLPGSFQIVSIAHGDRFVLRPRYDEDDSGSQKHIPLYVAGTCTQSVARCPTFLLEPMPYTRT